MRTSRKKFPRFDDEYDYALEYKEKSKRRPRYTRQETFKCRHCRRFIGSLPSGGHQRNHCPYCLYSRHVDGYTTGDRLSTCGASMEPIGNFQRSGGEFVIVHRCLDCGFERFNRIAADDNFELVLSLPELAPRNSRECKAQRRELGAQLETIIDRSRSVELFSCVEDHGIFCLEDPEMRAEA